jgi:hypothetical protein
MKILIKYSIIFVILLSSQLSFAQNYKFEVPEVSLDATINPDSSVELYYEILFRNLPGSHVIDYVDIGLPKIDLNYDVIEAGCDEEPAVSTGPSDYVKPGIAVGLMTPIPAGESGKFYFRIRIQDKMVFTDTTRDGYASFQITPTWFGSEYVSGLSSVTIRTILPEGVMPAEVLSQDVPYNRTETVNGSTAAVWEKNYFFVEPFRIGVSFPSRNMTGVIKQTNWDLVVQWYKRNEKYFNILFVPLTIFLAGWAIIRAGGAGCFAIVIGFIIFYFKIGHFFGRGFLLLVALGAAIFVEILRRMRRPSYLPALVSVEGGGIKRGLTAPEAAVLLELPANKIVTMILFGLIKKGFIREKEKDPLEFEAITPPPDSAVLHDYDKEALEVLARPSTYPSLKPYPVNERDFASVINGIVKSLTNKLKGHNVDETRSYYKQIVSRAWVEAKEIGDVQAWNKKMDEKIDWMMLDSDFEDRFRPYNTRYTPRYSFPASSSGSSGGKSTSVQGPSMGPGITNIAGSMASWMQNTSNSVVSSIAPKSMPLFDGEKIMKAADRAGGRSSGRSGGGGSCACACAGCACACACAGGGR